MSSVVTAIGIPLNSITIPVQSLAGTPITAGDQIYYGSFTLGTVASTNVVTNVITMTSGTLASVPINTVLGNQPDESGIPSQQAQTLVTSSAVSKFAVDIPVVSVGTTSIGQTVYYDNNILGTVFDVDTANSTIGIDASITTAIPSGGVLQVSSSDWTTVTLLKFNIGNTNYFLSDAYTPLTVGGDVYTALGDFLNISEFVEDYKATEGTVSIEISGIPAKTRFIDIIQNEKFKGASVRVYKAFMMSNTLRDVQEYRLRFQGIISNYNIEENTDLLKGESTNTLLLTGTSLYTSFSRYLGGQKTNQADRQRYVPTDSTFDNVVALEGIPEFG
jgi:hypothetical protein